MYIDCHKNKSYYLCSKHQNLICTECFDRKQGLLWDNHKGCKGSNGTRSCTFKYTNSRYLCSNTHPKCNKRGNGLFWMCIDHKYAICIECKEKVAKISNKNKDIIDITEDEDNYNSSNINYQSVSASEG